MKQVMIALLAVGLFVSISSCELFDKVRTVSFNLDYNSEVTVPQTTGIDLPFDLFTPDITTNSESTFSVKNTNKDLVSSVKLSEMVMTITSPTTQRFDFLKSLTVYIDAEGLGELEIATADNIADNIGGVLNMTLTQNNLKAYILKDKFKIRVKTVTDKTINDDVKFDVDSKFNVQAELL